MKNIKFRAWCISKKKMMNRYVLSLLKTILLGFILSWQNKNFIPLQYTGLLDKNWVEIYENDIVRYDLDWDWEIRLAVVPQLTPKARHRYWELQSLVDDWYYIEIIGNIYQNPELLN